MAELPQLLIEDWPTADGRRLALGGELDVATAPQVSAELGALRARAVGHVVIDLTAVSFIDCFALGVLVRERRLARSEGVKLDLVGVLGQVRCLFELTGTKFDR